MDYIMRKWLKIIWYTLLILLTLINFWIVVWLTQITENEYGPNELKEYYGCGQESQFTRSLCLGWYTQKNIVKELGEKILP